MYTLVPERYRCTFRRQMAGCTNHINTKNPGRYSFSMNFAWISFYTTQTQPLSFCFDNGCLLFFVHIQFFFLYFKFNRRDSLLFFLKVSCCSYVNKTNRWFILLLLLIKLKVFDHISTHILCDTIKIYKSSWYMKVCHRIPSIVIQINVFFILFIWDKNLWIIRLW